MAIRTENLEITAGTPKTCDVKGSNSGAKLQIFFCPDCGTTMFSRTSAFEHLSLLKSGIFDQQDTFAKCAPEVELFACRRPEWCTPAEGAKQAEEMLEGDDVEELVRRLSG